jgi:Bacterial membrane protein YfhO
VGGISRRVGLVLALLPLVFTGKALLLGELYGPSDLYYVEDPWKEVAAVNGIAGVRNPILSDLAFANLPWRAAVRDAVVNGRAPLWNRFALAGNPLLGTGSAAVFHPATWLGLRLPVALSWTFSCSYAIFLSLLSAFLYFRDFGGSSRAALVGAVTWAFSTYLIFWDGWSVGMSTGTLPMLLLGLRRIAHGRPGVGLTVAGLLLSFFGGHPETTFHVAVFGGVSLLWELAPRAARAPERLRYAGRAIFLAGGLALLLGAVQLFPLVEGLAHSAEYRARRTAVTREGSVQSVPLDEATRRLLPDVLPFAHGIYGRSVVQEARRDGSGMPLGYAGAIVFPLALMAFSRHPPVRGRFFFLGCVLIGFAFGASFPGLLDLMTRLPGFALALNYRLVFISALGFAGLSALGIQALEEGRLEHRLAMACGATAAALVVLFLVSGGAFRARQLPAGFVRWGSAAEILPIVALGAFSLIPNLRASRLSVVALLLLGGQRALEADGTYPTLPASTLAPPLPTLGAVVDDAPSRIVATGSVMRPNGASLYGLEDVRGYEAVVLDRLVDTFPLWCSAQHASFNRVDDLSRPFLSLLNVRFAIAPPDAPLPAGWDEQARGADLAVFRNRRSLPRAFVPRAVRTTRDPLSDMASVPDFRDVAFVEDGAAVAESPNGPAELHLRESGPDLFVEVSSPSPVFIATSIPDWPGWTATAEGAFIPTVTVNHAFVGFRLAAGRRTVLLRYEPRSWRWGLGAAATGIVLVAILSVRRRAKHRTGAFRDS